MNKNETLKGLMLLKANYRIDYSEKQIELFHIVLKKYHVEDFQNAIIKIIEREIFPPVIATIIKYIEVETGTPFPTLAETQYELNQLHKKHGRNNPPNLEVISNPIIKLIIKSNGWATMCNMSEKDYNYMVQAIYKNAKETMSTPDGMFKYALPYIKDKKRAEFFADILDSIGKIKETPKKLKAEEL